MSTIVATLLCCLGAYLVCSIPCGLFVAKLTGGVDVRTTGSGNIGTTNVARSVGIGAAVATLACDAGKGFISVVVSRWILALVGGTSFSLGAPWTMPLVYPICLVFIACVVGHIFSCYLRFKGGKGIAVGLGAGLGVWWPMALGLLALFILLAVPTKRVSIGSVAAAAAVGPAAFICGATLFQALLLACGGLVVIWAHRTNIARLLRGEEPGLALGGKAQSHDKDAS